MLGDAVLQAMVGVSQPDAARQFYGETLGLKLVQEDNFAMVFVGKVGFLRVSKVPAVMPAAYAVLAFVVEDIAAAVAGLAQKGVTFERFAFFAQDDMGVWTAPDDTKVAWFRDPDLNLLSLVQYS